MHKKLSLLIAGSIAGLTLVISALHAADAPAASGNATTPAAPAASAPATSGNTAIPMPPPAPTGNMTPPGPKIDLTKLPKPSDKKDLTFAKDIEPIFKASCAGCHFEPTNADRPSGGLNLTTLALALKGGRAGKDVVPGKSQESLVVLYTAGLVAGKEMPTMRSRPTHPALTNDQIGLIRAWIDQGAK